MSGGMCRLALLHRAGSFERFQIRLNENQGTQLASRQQRASGAQKQLAEVLRQIKIILLLPILACFLMQKHNFHRKGDRSFILDPNICEHVLGTQIQVTPNPMFLHS